MTDARVHGRTLMPDGVDPLHDLPQQVAAVLSGLIAEAEDVCGDDLVAMVLFGSAADGTLGPTSDINLLVILRAFAPDQIGRLDETFLAAEAAITLQPMFLLQQEIPRAAELFAQKFADILRRRRTIYGRDVLASLTIPRGPEIFRLRQVLLNLGIRLRQSCVLRSATPEQVARILADNFGPLRAAAATLRELEGAAPTSADAAFKEVAAAFGPSGEAAAAQLYAAHEGRSNDSDPRAVLFNVATLVMEIAARAERLA